MDGFFIDKDNLVLNAVVLVNAYVRSADLSSTSPIVRVTGFQGKSSETGEVGQQFMHMLRPSSEQLFSKFPVDVRRFCAMCSGDNSTMGTGKCASEGDEHACTDR